MLRQILAVARDAAVLNLVQRQRQVEEVLALHRVQLRDDLLYRVGGLRLHGVI